LGSVRFGFFNFRPIKPNKSVFKNSNKFFYGSAFFYYFFDFFNLISFLIFFVHGEPVVLHAMVKIIGELKTKDFI